MALPQEFAERLWRPAGYALPAPFDHIAKMWAAQNPTAVGDLKVYPPDNSGFCKLEFKGRINAKAP